MSCHVTCPKSCCYHVWLCITQVVKALTASETAYSASPSKPITESSPLAGNETTLVALVQVRAHILATDMHSYQFAAIGQNTVVASHEGMLRSSPFNYHYRYWYGCDLLFVVTSCDLGTGSQTCLLFCLKACHPGDEFDLVACRRETMLEQL